MAVALGKRYKDENSEIEVLCIKPGECNLNVDGRGMEELQPKVLPSPTSSAGSRIHRQSREAALRLPRRRTSNRGPPRLNRC